VVGDCSTSTRAAEFPGALDVVEGGGGAAGSDCEQVVCYTTWLRTVSAPLLEWGLLSVATAEVDPERPGAWPKAWFSISFPYRKLGSGSNRTSSRVPLRKRNRCAVTGSEQNREAEHRCDEAPSEE